MHTDHRVDELERRLAETDAALSFAFGCIICLFASVVVLALMLFIHTKEDEDRMENQTPANQPQTTNPAPPCSVEEYVCGICGEPILIPCKCSDRRVYAPSPAASAAATARYKAEFLRLKAKEHSSRSISDGQPHEVHLNDIALHESDHT